MLRTNHVEKRVRGIFYFSDLEEQKLYTDRDGVLFMKTGDKQSIVFADWGNSRVEANVGADDSITAPFLLASKRVYVTLAN